MLLLIANKKVIQGFLFSSTVATETPKLRLNHGVGGGGLGASRGEITGEFTRAMDLLGWNVQSVVWLSSHRSKGKFVLEQEFPKCG